MQDPSEPAPLPPALKRLDLSLITLLLLLTFFLGSFIAANSEVWLHLASGRNIAHGIWADTFSFTATDVPWVNQSWLYSYILYALHGLVGGPGLVILKALAVTVLAFTLIHIPGGTASRFLSVLYVGLAMLALIPQITLRPMAFSFLLFGITLTICHRGGALGSVPGNPRILWRLPLLFLLWANLDVWFIMGPLFLALLAIGAGIGALFGFRSAVSGKTLAAVLGVSLLACLVNPYHYRAFLLPTELANLVVRVVDVPDFLVRGGRALRNAQLIDPTYALISPLSGRYWSDLSARGQLIPSAAALVLVALAVISFVVNAAVARKPGAAGLHPGRFVVWIFLTFLALLHAPLIPWFAIASAPITLLNVTDWRRWLAHVQVSARPFLYLGRLATLFGGVILIVLAWPGWLFASLDNFASPRRVGWDIRVDPSYKQAALELAKLKNSDQELRVFNFSWDTAHYCAWFAPGVKCFVDSRLPLFADVITDALRTRSALAANVPGEWQKTLDKYQIRHLALAKYGSERDAEVIRRDAEIVHRLWMDEGHWLQRYGDGRSVLFEWSGPQAAFAGEFRQGLLRRAFAQVPAEQRAPTKGPALPLEEPSFASLYLHGPEPFPLAGTEAILWFDYYQLMAKAWRGPHLFADQVARCALSMGRCFLALPVPVAPSSRDLGPPAAPLLMLRCARRALAEEPEAPPCYLVLRDVLQGPVLSQEEHWLNYAGQHRAAGLRPQIRQVQIITALQIYLELRPDDPGVNKVVSDMFVPMRFLDSALAHLQKTVAHLAVKKSKESLEKTVKKFEEEVKNIRERYELAASTKEGLEKSFLALKFGLAEEALKQLHAMKTKELSAQEQHLRDRQIIYLMLMMGRANYLGKDLSKLGPEFGDLKAFHAAAVGDYDELDRDFKEMEEARKRSHALILSRELALYTQLLFVRTPAAAFAPLSVEGLVRQFTQDEAALRSLRGLMRLEVGDTDTALRFFNDAFQLAGDGSFEDRPIAERYRDLLQAARK